MPGSQGVLIPRRLAGRPQATFSHAPGPSPHLPVAQARRLRWSPNSRSLSFSSSHLLFSLISCLFSLTSCLFLSHSSLVIQSFIIERSLLPWDDSFFLAWFAGCSHPGSKAGEGHDEE